MAVKITQINDLSELQTKISQYSTSMSDASNAAQTTFTAKLEGSEAGSVTQFVGVMNQLKSDAFSQLPQATTNFAQALQTYHSALTGAGFNNLIKSVKPTVEDEYCQKVTSTEYEKFEEKANEIKTVINEVAGVLPEVSESKIETHLTSLHTELQNKTNEIKATRSTVQEAQTAFKSKLEEVSSELAQCMTSIENTMNLTDPKSGLKPATMVKLISQGTGGIISSLLQSDSMSNEDIKALNSLGEKDYEKFFALNPDKLNDAIYALLVGQITEMIEFPAEGDAPKVQTDLQNLLNALLMQSEPRIEAHAMKILTMNDLMAMQYAGLLAVGDKDWMSAFGINENMSTTEKNKLLEQINQDKGAALQTLNKLSALSSLWEAVIIMDTPTTPNGREKVGPTPNTTRYEFRNFDISILTLSHNGDFNFNLNKTGTIYSNENSKTGYPINQSLKVDALTHADTLSQSNAKAREKLKQIREQKAQEINKAIASVGVTGIGIFIPGADKLAAVVQAIANSNVANTIKGVTSMKPVAEVLKPAGFSDAAQKNTTALLSAANTVENLYNKLSSLDDESAKTQLDILMNLLNAGGKEVRIEDIFTGDKNTVLTAPGVPTVETQKRIDELSTNGFMGYVNSKDKGSQLGQVLGQVDSNGDELEKPKKLTKEEEFIYYGSNGPNKVLLEELDFEKLTSNLQDWMRSIGLNGDDAGTWVRSYGK